MHRFRNSKTEIKLIGSLVIIAIVAILGTAFIKYSKYNVELSNSPVNSDGLSVGSGLKEIEIEFTNEVLENQKEDFVQSIGATITSTTTNSSVLMTVSDTINLEEVSKIGIVKDIELTKNNSEVVMSETGGYPYSSNSTCDSSQGCQQDPWNFFMRECTSYVAWKLNAVRGIPIYPESYGDDDYFFHNNMAGQWSDASNWLKNNIDNKVFQIGSQAVKGAVAVWNADSTPNQHPEGHVAYVEDVTSDGKVFISDYNYNNNHDYSYRELLASEWPDSFMYMNPQQNSSSNRVIFYEDVNYNSNNKFFIVDVASNTKKVKDLPQWIDNRVSSIWISSNKCLYAFGQSINDYNENVSEAELQNLIYSEWINSSTNTLSNTSWDYGPGNVNDNITGYAIGNKCSTQTRESSQSISQCFNGPGSSGDSGGTNQGDSSDFISDVTVPDGQVMPPNNSFTKIWRLKNNGTSTWNSGYRLVFQSGYKMNALNEVMLNQNVTPGATIDIAVSMTSPNIEGTYKGNWKMKNASGGIFGDFIWTEIKVKNGSTAPPTGGQVKLYSSINYQNLIKSYGSGEYNDPNANSFSLEIPSGWSVITYRNDGFSGQEKCWYQSIANLQDHEDWQNKIQSIRVFSYDKCGGGGKVKLYSSANYQNLIGEYGLGKTTEPNNNSYSMSIPSGWSVKTFRNNEYGGGERCWNTSVANLQDHENWQLDIDSLEIFPVNVCPNTESYVEICRETGHNNCTRINANISDLRASGFGNDTLKSIKVQGSWEIAVFEHENYLGKKYITTSSKNDLRVDTGFEYGSSSIILRKTDSQAFTLYENNDFGGNAFRSDRAVIDFDQWNFNDKGDSIKIHGNHEIIMCTNGNFQSYCRRTKTSISNLGQFDSRLHDGISSIQVCDNECPATPAKPGLASPLDTISFLPGSTIIFSWSGNADKYLINIWGGALLDTISHGWDANSTYSVESLPFSNSPYYWKVSGWNTSGEGDWSNTKTFYIKDTVPDSVYIFGPTTTELNTEVTLNADINPVDATNLTYSWNPQPIRGQGTISATFKWDTAGTKQISLSVSNPAGSAQKTHQISIGCPDHQWFAEYYNNKNLSENPSSGECENEINKNWGIGGPSFSNGQDLIVTTGQKFKVDQIKSRITGNALVNTKNITVQNVAGFNIGDEILVIQISGGNGAGRYEKNTVESINGSNLNMKSNLINTYEYLLTAKSQVIKIPKYNNVTVQTGGVITADSWDDTLGVGGIVIFDAAGEVKIENGGLIDISSSGFKGGLGGNESNASRADTGSTGGSILNSESLNGPLASDDCGGCTSPIGPSNAGGGLGGRGSRGLDSAGGGAGGSHITKGTAGQSVPQWPNAPGGQPGNSYGTSDLSKLYFGSGGGGGGKGKDGYGDSGGNGGGIIFIKSNKLINNGTITAAGGTAPRNGKENAGGGGGGAGGSVLLESQNLTTVANGININGKEGSPGNAVGNGRPGGTGGQGIVHIKYCESANGFTGSTTTIRQITCPVDNFSVRWSKTQNFELGIYTIKATADDGFRIKINDIPIMSQWKDGLNTRELTLNLSGEKNIAVEYYESTGNAQIKVSIDRAENQAPKIIKPVGSQTITNNDLKFQSFDLDDYGYDDGTSALWTASRNNQLLIEIDPQTNIVMITRPSSNWIGEETIHFTLTDELGQNATTVGRFKAIAAPNQTPIITKEIPSQTISGDQLNFTQFDLDEYGSDDGITNWAVTGNSSLIVNKDNNNIVSISRTSNGWEGEETLTFKLADELGAFATTTANFKAEAKIVDPEEPEPSEGTVKIGWSFKKSTWENKNATYAGVTNQWISSTNGFRQRGSDYYSQTWNWGNANDDCGQIALSPISGTIIFAGKDSFGDYGNQVIVQSNINPNYAWRAVHLKTISVKKNDVITGKTKVGTIGKTGDAVQSECQFKSILYKNLSMPYLSNSPATALSRLKNGQGLGGTLYNSPDEPNQFAAKFEQSSVIAAGEIPTVCELIIQPGVTLFKKNNCTGEQVNFTTTGSFNLNNYSFNKSVKAIYIQEGYSVRVFKKPNNQGASKCISSTLEKLVKIKYDNKALIIVDGKSTIASVTVFSNNNCTETEIIRGSELKNENARVEEPIQVEEIDRDEVAPVTSYPESYVKTY